MRGNRIDRGRRRDGRALGNAATLLALAVLLGRAAAATVDPGSGVSLGLQSAAHGSYASGEPQGQGAPVLTRAFTATGAGGGALTIDVTFDSTITGDPNAAAIEAMINDAVSVYQALFDDPIVVSIRFRYATTYADGTTPLSPGLLAASQTGLHVIAWDTFLGALRADATTANDATANATLPVTALTAHVDPSSAGGRAAGLNTQPVMFADGSIGVGGTYDGIVTINSNAAFKFTRPPAGGMYDAQRSVEHEIDEVLGLGSAINRLSDVRPQDLFSWSSPGVRSLSASGARYFSIDGGTTNLVGFNQNSNGDFGDWLSGPCPQTDPFVQNAFSCAGQTSDVTETSPEGINLDVVGYDLVVTTTTTVPGATSTTVTTTTSTTLATSTTVVGSSTTTTTVPCLPPQIECCPVGQPGCGLCGTDCGNGGCCFPSAPVCDNVNNLCLVCAAPQIECCPAGQPGCGICGTDCGNGGCCPPSAPVCDNVNGVCLVSGPVCPEGQVQCDDAALGFTDVACCSQPVKSKQCGAACGPIVAACRTSCSGGSGVKKCKKRCRTVIVGHCRQSRPRACS